MLSLMRWTLVFLTTAFFSTKSPAQSIWTNKTTVPGFFDQCIYGNGTYVAVGTYGGLPISGSVIWTEQGDSGWFERYRTTDGGRLHDVVWTGNKFVAIGEKSLGIVVSSTNGLDWVQESLTNTPALIALAWCNGTFAALGYNGTVARSPDGVVWTNDIIRTRFQPFGIACSGKRFVASGKSNGAPGSDISPLMSSLDGIMWESSSVPALDVVFSRIRWLNDRFIAVGVANGRDAFATSLDGINWQVSNLKFFDGYYDVAFANGVYVAVGKRILTSADGYHWVHQRAFLGSPGLFSVCAGPDSFVGSGYQLISSPFDLYFRGSSADNGVFSSRVFGIGDGADIQYSNDATNWLQLTNLIGPDATFSVPVDSSRLFRAIKH